MTSYAEKAMDYFSQGYNCAQSVVTAFNDKLNLDFETALKLSSSFGGGMADYAKFAEQSQVCSL